MCGVVVQAWLLIIRWSGSNLAEIICIYFEFKKEKIWLKPIIYMILSNMNVWCSDTGLAGDYPLVWFKSCWSHLYLFCLKKKKYA